jgi:hypothetical protein
VQVWITGVREAPLHVVQVGTGGSATVARSIAMSVLPFVALWLGAFFALHDRGTTRAVSALGGFLIALPALVVYGVLLGVITQATSR